MSAETNINFSVSQAIQNFSAVAETAEKTGKAVVFQNDKPKYLILDMEQGEPFQWH